MNCHKFTKLSIRKEKIQLKVLPNPVLGFIGHILDISKFETQWRMLPIRAEIPKIKYVICPPYLLYKIPPRKLPNAVPKILLNKLVIKIIK